MTFQEHYTCTSLHLQAAEDAISRVENFLQVFLGNDVPKTATVISRMMVNNASKELDDIRRKHFDALNAEDEKIGQEVVRVINDITRRIEKASKELDAIEKLPAVNMIPPISLYAN